MLQRIETPTGTGIPDAYYSLLSNDKNVTMWIETKTVDYKVSNEQLNWATTHWLTGGLTFLVTRIKSELTNGKLVAPPKNAPKTTSKNHNQTAYNNPTLCSTLPTHALPYPQLPELFVGRYMQGEMSIVSYDQLITSAQKKGKETLVFLPFDDRMRDCSTLGVYLRRHNPGVLPVEEWLVRQAKFQ